MAKAEKSVGVIEEGVDLGGVDRGKQAGHGWKRENDRPIVRFSFNKTEERPHTQSSFDSSFPRDSAPGASTHKTEPTRFSFLDRLNKPVAQTTRPYTTPAIPSPRPVGPSKPREVVDKSISRPWGDPLAELDAFLASGAVRIVDKFEDED